MPSAKRINCAVLAKVRLVVVDQRPAAFGVCVVAVQAFLNRVATAELRRDVIGAAVTQSDDVVMVTEVVTRIVARVSTAARMRSSRFGRDRSVATLLIVDVEGFVVTQRHDLTGVTEVLLGGVRFGHATLGVVGGAAKPGLDLVVTADEA